MAEFQVVRSSGAQSRTSAVRPGPRSRAPPALTVEVERSRNPRDDSPSTCRMRIRSSSTPPSVTSRSTRRVAGGSGSAPCAAAGAPWQSRSATNHRL
jgi:hypothetical protein